MPQFEVPILHPQARHGVRDYFVTFGVCVLMVVPFSLPAMVFALQRLRSAPLKRKLGETYIWGLAAGIPPWTYLVFYVPTSRRQLPIGQTFYDMHKSDAGELAQRSTQVNFQDVQQRSNESLETGNQPWSDRGSAGTETKVPDIVDSSAERSYLPLFHPDARGDLSAWTGFVATSVLVAALIRRSVCRLFLGKAWRDITRRDGLNVLAQHYQFKLGLLDRRPSVPVSMKLRWASWCMAPALVGSVPSVTPRPPPEDRLRAQEKEQQDAIALKQAAQRLREKRVYKQRDNNG